MSKRTFEIKEEGTHYELPIYEVIDGKGIQPTGDTHSLKFVRGSILNEEGITKHSGTLHEHLLAAMIHDLKYKNSLVPSREGSIVITKLEEALMWTEERQRAREAAGTVGTYKK